MRAHHLGFTVRSSAAVLLALAFAQVLPPPAQGGVEVVKKDDFSLELGLRIQPRIEFEQVPASWGRRWQRDFLVRRTRLKVNGKMEAASYGFEWKIDGTDQINGPPSAQVENAWIQVPLGGGVELRAGLYDQPYSRDRLTSDSRQLAVDRGAVSNVPDAIGLADNAVGFHLLGKVHGGRAAYAVGLFDNRKIPGQFKGVPSAFRSQDVPMVVGRLDLNFGSTASLFQDTHFGGDSWYSLGVNGSYQGSLENTTGKGDGSNGAVGMDGMIDVPAGPGRLFARGEANATKTEPAEGGNSVDTTVWMLGLGYLVLNQRLQPIVRFDQVRSDEAVEGGGTKNITHVGVNLYQKEHSLKVQGDVRLESGTGESVDGIRLQAQVDY